MLPLSLSQLSLNNMGLLNQKKDPFSDPNAMGLLGAGLALLESSGPSTTPTSLGQAVGRAGMAGLQMRQQGIANQNAQSEAEFNKQYKQAQMAQMLKNNGIIGDLTPGNYTPESLALFADDYQKNMKPNYALLKESVNPMKAGGVIYGTDANGKLVQMVDPNVVAGTAGQIAGAQAAGAATGKAQAEAAQSIGPMQDKENQLLRILGDPNFSGAVGPVDALWGKYIGEPMGTKSGVLGGEVERVANSLVSEAADKWKGAISEKELDMFKASVPGRGSSPETWDHWYQNEYLPRKQRVEASAGVSPQGTQQASAKVRKYNPQTGKLE